MNNNFLLNKNNLNEEVYLKGWVKKIRKLGNLTFFDLRKETHLVQVVIEEKSKLNNLVQTLKNEDVIFLVGKVVERKSKNDNLYSGEIEINAKKIQIINKAKQTPLIIDNNTDALEPKRLEYRYLDLRREVNQKMLKQRSLLNQLIRSFFYEKDFIEIETPLITKSTVGGAGEFGILSKQKKDQNYSLVQSPQIYKQLLMYSGVSKYFQIAKCFRDEDSRSDRQLEFTQLDMEWNFIEKEDTINIINALLKEILFKFKKKENLEIAEMSYKDALKYYGTDKPDLRYENKIEDLTKYFSKSTYTFLSDSVLNNETIKGLYFKNKLSNNDLKKINETIKSQGSKGMAWLLVSEGEISGSLKNLKPKIKDKLRKHFNTNYGMLIVVYDKELSALEYIGRIRGIVAEKLNMIDESKDSLVWIKDFPLFIMDDNKKITYAHNPFTSPDEKGMKILNGKKELTTDLLLKIKSTAYDIVYNGTEIGGGAMRINEPQLQKQIFKLLGMKDKFIDQTFGWFLEAQTYGVPKHGGIALGIDRLLIILLNKSSIRDVIAFPKTSHGTDEMIKIIKG